MAHNVSHHTQEDAAVIVLSGYIEQEACVKVIEIFEKLLPEKKTFIFDFSEVSIVNSGGISCLLDIFSRKIADTSLKFALCKLNHSTQYSFKIVGIFNLAKEFPDVEAAAKELCKKAV